MSNPHYSCFCDASCADIKNFEQPCCALPAPDAHRNDDIPSTTALTLQQRMPDEARAGNTVRMPQCNGAAIDVEALHRNAEFVGAVKHLDSECLVQLPKADVIDR